MSRGPGLCEGGVGRTGQWCPSPGEAWESVPEGGERADRNRALVLRATAGHGGLKTGSAMARTEALERPAEQCQGREGRTKGAAGDSRTLEGVRRSELLMKGLLGCGAEGELRGLSRGRPCIG